MDWEPQIPPGLLTTRWGQEGASCQSEGVDLLQENPRENAALAKTPPQSSQEAGARGELAAEGRAVMERGHSLPRLASRPLSRVTGPAVVTHSFRTGCSCTELGLLNNRH